MDTQDHAIYHVWIHFFPTSLYPRREKTIWSELESNPGPLASQATAPTTRPLLLGRYNWSYLGEARARIHVSDKNVGPFHFHICMRRSNFVSLSQGERSRLICQLSMLIPCIELRIFLCCTASRDLLKGTTTEKQKESEWKGKKRKDYKGKWIW